MQPEAYCITSIFAQTLCHNPVSQKEFALFTATVARMVAQSAPTPEEFIVKLREAITPHYGEVILTFEDHMGNSLELGEAPVMMRIQQNRNRVLQ